MQKHVMIDIETWGKGSNALIVSIGAVKFDPLDPAGEFDNFQVAIDPRGFSQMFEIDPDTILYWMDQKRRPPLDHWLSCEKVDLGTALWGFIGWFGEESLPTWGNGATFDNVILLNAIFKVGRDRPWTYKHDRCYRTLSALCPQVPKPSDADMMAILLEHYQAVEGAPEADRIPHTALYDAQCQAVHMRRIMQEVTRYDRLLQASRVEVPARLAAGLGRDPAEVLARADPMDNGTGLDIMGNPYKVHMGIDPATTAGVVVMHEDAVTGQLTAHGQHRPAPEPRPTMAQMLQDIDREADEPDPDVRARTILEREHSRYDPRPVSSEAE